MKPATIHSPRPWHCIEHYTAHGLRALLSRWLQRIFN